MCHVLLYVTLTLHFWFLALKLLCLPHTKRVEMELEYRLDFDEYVKHISLEVE